MNVNNDINDDGDDDAVNKVEHEEEALSKYPELRTQHAVHNRLRL